MKIIVKREPKRTGGNLIIFFPETFENRESSGIEFYTFEGYHGECPYEFYLECKPEKVSPEILERIEKYFLCYPLPEKYTIKKKIVRK